MNHSSPSRREFAKLALTALPAAGLLSVSRSLQGAETAAPAMPMGKPNSKVNGVQIGLNVPYSFGNNMMSADDTLKNRSLTCEQTMRSGGDDSN